MQSGIDQNKEVLSAAIPSASIWQELRNAIRGTSADYTAIGLRRAIFLLAVPMILELVMESTFAIADIYFVSRLGSSAVATVGLTETILFLLYSIGIGLSMSVTAIVARRIGEKNEHAAGVTAVQSILIGFVVSLPFTFAGIFYSQELMALMGADAWVLDHGSRYTGWMLGGNGVIMLLFVINAIFRGAGDAAIAMRVLIIANGLNIILDPLLIFGLGPIPALGIEGAALATNIGRGTGVLIQLWYLFRAGKHMRLTASQFRFHARSFIDLVRTSLGGVGQMIIAMTAWIFLMRILADVGTAAVAGATICMRIMMFTLMPAWGMSNAAATLVGQNLGAGQPERAESSVWKIGFYNMGYLVLVSLLFFVFSRELIGLFSDDRSVIAIGSEWLRILAISFCVYGWWMVAVQAFNGAGDTVTPTWINLIFFWMIQIPLAYALAIGLDHGHSGVFWAAFISETSVGLFTLWLFHRGGWKSMRV
jgi:putative MATE family efflux protein